MISCERFYSTLIDAGIKFFTGVPDSLQKNFVNYLRDNVGPQAHLIAANEGAAVGHAIGYYLATGNLPLVYMQNSGLGNAINPVVSAVNDRVFGIPMVLMIGWRGEPGIADEPQHQAQGEITLQLLQTLGIPHTVIGQGSENDTENIRFLARRAKEISSAVALVVRKGAFSDYTLRAETPNQYQKREEALKKILPLVPSDAAVFSTTGKLSRELFELRYPIYGNGFRDFLTVGSMGHCHAIALGAALANSEKRVICLDGDGSLLMHMGTLAISGAHNQGNLYYILFNNGAHESVGGQPTVGFQVDFKKIAEACGFEWARSCDDLKELRSLFLEFLDCGRRAFLEIRIGIGSRADLGRPALEPQRIKSNLMEFLRG